MQLFRVFISNPWSHLTIVSSISHDVETVMWGTLVLAQTPVWTKIYQHVCQLLLHQYLGKMKSPPVSILTREFWDVIWSKETKGIIQKTQRMYLNVWLYLIQSTKIKMPHHISYIGTSAFFYFLTLLGVSFRCTGDLPPVDNIQQP